MNIANQSSLAQLRDFIDEYVCALDERRGQDWLSLFVDDGYYAVLRQAEYATGNNVLLIGEDMKRLKARVASGFERDKRRTVHTVSGVRGDADGTHCRAAFALWSDGLPSYAGRYEMSLASTEGGLRIQKCTVVLDNDIVESPIYNPI